MNILISEVAGQGRWTQFNLKLGWVQPFFGSPAPVMTQVHLCELSGSGAITSAHSLPAIYKPNSSNWAFEIPGAHGLKYPGKLHRPILVIAQRASGTYPFELLMPGDGRYAGVSRFLAANRQTPKRHLARAIVPRTALGMGLLGLKI
jgi:hypothetical protein